MMEERDTRGWILTVCSALACCAGASVIFIDLLPWKRFSIKDNSTFLSACLSLSFSVLAFSSARLFGEATTYLEKAHGPNPYYIITVSFSAGFLICYYLFKFLHRFIPHRTVSCDDESEDDEDKPHHSENGYGSGSSGATLVRQPSPGFPSKQKINDEETPLLPNGKGLERRPTLAKRLTDTMGKLTGKCVEDGRCYGFITCPCEGRCMHPKGVTPKPHACQPGHCKTKVSLGGHPCIDECEGQGSRHFRDIPILEDEDHFEEEHGEHDDHDHDHNSHHHDHDDHSEQGSHGNANKHQHHHHVANNAFVGIGFQTSLAIALHRCPDGFITFVTNHADKNLGFTIFLSLFIHSAVDGFTMCLPLYLALGSAWKAVLITFFVGGLAQPLGGLFAYTWLKVGSAPSETVYGIIFSFTAGLMAVVAVQLLRQIPSDHNHPDLPYISMLAGAVLMCLSLALTSS